MSGAGQPVKNSCFFSILVSALIRKSGYFSRESSVKWELRDLEIHTYLPRCWQAVVITDREKLMGGKGLMPQRKQTARSLTIQQPLWSIISCDGCVGWKIPRDPSCTNAVMLWHLDDYLWEGCFHFPLCLQRSGNGWKEWAILSCSVVHTTLTGHLHLLLWWILLALLTLQISERQGASPCNARRLPRGGGTFLYTYYAEFR